MPYSVSSPLRMIPLKMTSIIKGMSIALMDFDGTLIVVSHDRDFLDGLVTKVYEFGNKKVTEHLCGIYEFRSEERRVGKECRSRWSPYH